MSKTLSTILTLFKIARVIAKIIFILCIIGLAGCLIALLMLPLVEGILPPDILAEAGLEINSVYLACIAAAVSCAAEGVFAFLAERYFKSVIEDGTPFTFSGAKRALRLGLISLIISFATSLIVGIFLGMYAILSSDLSSMDINTSISVSTGLFFLFISLIFKHGAEVQEAANTSRYQEYKEQEEYKAYSEYQAQDTQEQ